MKVYDLSISVVLYNNNPAEIKNLINCISQTSLNYKLFLIDNSPKDDLRFFAYEKNVEYVFNNKNLGFGRAQNISINMAVNQSRYHLILNPDIIFPEGVLDNIYAFMEKNPDIGQLMPKIYYSNGELQRLCKLLPHPVDLIGRRFLGNLKWVQLRNSVYELCNFSYDKMLDTPNLSGCFMFIRTSVLKQVKGFDPRFFMYLEDFDLTRRIHKIARTVFYPDVSVIHEYNKGSYSNPLLFRYHVISAIRYFNKWGWFFDKERKKFNEKVLLQLS